MDIVIILVFFIIIGGIIVNAIGTHREGATQESKMFMAGSYDILAGIISFCYATQELKEIMPKDEEQVFTYLKYFGILYIVIGVIQLLSPVFISGVKGMISEEADKKIREQRRLERELAEMKQVNTAQPIRESATVNFNKNDNIGPWICSTCGAENEGAAKMCERCGMYR